MMEDSPLLAVLDPQCSQYRKVLPLIIPESLLALLTIGALAMQVVNSKLYRISILGQVVGVIRIIE